MFSLQQVTATAHNTACYNGTRKAQPITCESGRNKRGYKKNTSDTKREIDWRRKRRVREQDRRKETIECLDRGIVCTLVFLIPFSKQLMILTPMAVLIYIMF